MKVWLFDIMFWSKPAKGPRFPFPASEWDPQFGMDHYLGHLRYLQRADELGFDGVCLAEHHMASHGTCPSPNLMAAAVATSTEQAKIVLLGNVLPLRGHPVRMAEELALLDVLSKGRLVSGFIRGGFTEWYAYSLNANEARGRFEEAWDLIVKAWTAKEPFAWHGTYYHYDNVSIMPRPIQQPHPPLVMAASTAESLEWCAQRHVPVASSFAPTDSMRETFDYYRKYASEQCGWAPGPEHCIVSRQVYVAPTNQQAREEAEGHLLAFFDEVPTAHRLSPQVEAYRAASRSDRSFAYKSDQTGHQFLAQSGGRAAVQTAEAAPTWIPGGAPQLAQVPEKDAPPTYSYEQLQRDGLCIIGDPDHVTEQIRHQQRVLGVGTFVIYIPFGTMPTAQATRSIELFAKEVLPNLRD